MTEIHLLLETIRRLPGCVVDTPRGQPTVRDIEEIPVDLEQFYTLGGGVTLFGQCDYHIRIVGPSELVRSDPEIVGIDSPDDITDSWYIVARGGTQEIISIDCNPSRRGRCYDSFWDSHGVVGSCRIIALSFTELLRRIVDNEGRYWYWLGGHGPEYGDAYSPSIG